MGEGAGKEGGEGKEGEEGEIEGRVVLGTLKLHARRIMAPGRLPREDQSGISPFCQSLITLTAALVSSTSPFFLRQLSVLPMSRSAS